jgi:hypothetical protein
MGLIEKGNTREHRRYSLTLVVRDDQGQTETNPIAHPCLRVSPMSLHPQRESAIPEETQRVAHAAFPKGTLCHRIADELGPIYRDDQFADLFPTRGQPADSPARLALVSVLQYVEALSDRQAADAVTELSNRNIGSFS